MQSRMLTSALSQLAPGGKLVYSTCSMEPEENENVVDRALHDSPSIRRVAISEAAKILAPHLAPTVSASELFEGDGYLRTSPAVHHTDGFFAALLKKG